LIQTGGALFDPNFWDFFGITPRKSPEMVGFTPEIWDDSLKTPNHPPPPPPPKKKILSQKIPLFLG